MIKTKLGFDNIFVINLKSRNDRREMFNNRFSGIDYEYIDAIGGQELDIPKLIKKKIVSEYMYDPACNMNKNIVACGLSHIKVWERFLKTKDETCLIFEDDVFFTKPIIRPEFDVEKSQTIMKTTHDWNEMMKQLETLKWDIVLLGQKERYVDGIDKTPLFCQPFWSSGKFGAHAYLINKKSVKKLIKESKPMKYVSDVMIHMMIEKMNVFALKESLFRQESDIYQHDMKKPESIDSDTFHNNYRGAKFTEVKVDETVHSVEFINYPSSEEYDGDKRWPPLVKVRMRT